MTRGHVAALAALVAAATISAQPLKQGRKQDISITAGDGFVLKGTHYSPGKRGPAVLLLHQCNSDRKSWDQLATDLTNAGMHVLALDFRGYGESGPPVTDQQQRRTMMTEKWPGDVEAAFAILQSLEGVDRSRIAVGGASCGVTQASILAPKRKDVQALVLLSGSASAEGRAYLTATPGVAVFGAAAENDGNAAKAIGEAVSASKNPQSVSRIVKGSAHGVPMFAETPDLEPAIVEWLKARLEVK